MALKIFKQCSHGISGGEERMVELWAKVYLPCILQPLVTPDRGWGLVPPGPTLLLVYGSQQEVALELKELVNFLRSFWRCCLLFTS